jgi:hypothetical protein
MNLSIPLFRPQLSTGYSIEDRSRIDTARDSRKISTGTGTALKKKTTITSRLTKNNMVD